MIQNIVKSFRPIEQILLLYLLITLPFVLFQMNSGVELGIGYTHLSCMAILIVASYFQIKFPKKSEQIKWIVIFYPLLFLGFLYKETDYINNIIFHNNLDNWFIYLEEYLFGFQPSVSFSVFYPSNVFAESMYFGYFAYYLLLIFVPVILLIKRGYQVTDKFIFIVIQSFLFYYLFFIIVPVVGPQFYLKDLAQLPRGYLFGDLIRTIQASGEAPTAAFPSSHVAMCLIIIFMVYKELNKLWIYLLPISLLLIFSTVYIQAHYAVDIIAAFITAPFIYLLSLKVYSLLMNLKPYNH